MKNQDKIVIAILTVSILLLSGGVFENTHTVKPPQASSSSSETVTKIKAMLHDAGLTPVEAKFWETSK